MFIINFFAIITFCGLIILMKVIGIDPGYGRVGWAVLKGDTSEQKLIEYGCLETNPSHLLSRRLTQIYDFVLELIKKHKPNEAAVEELYYFKNAKTVMGVGQARGAIIVAFTGRKIPVFDYTPLQIKSSVAGYGKAEKIQVQKMVKTLLHLKELPVQDDAADACAVALTHLFSNRKLT